MAIRGTRIPFLGKVPVLAEGEERAVKLLPVQEEISNGRMGLLDQWQSRPGFVEHAAFGNSTDVVHVTAHESLVAICQDGKVYRGLSEDFSEWTELEGRIEGHARPVSVIHDDAVIVTAGGKLFEVEATKVRELGVPSLVPKAPKVQELVQGKVPTGDYRYVCTLTTVAGESTMGEPSRVVRFRNAAPYGTKIQRPALDETERRWALAWSVYRETYPGGGFGLIATATIETEFILDLVEETLGDLPTLDLSSSTPPASDTLAVVGDYVFAGNGTTLRWCDPANHDLWSELATTEMPVDGGSIQWLAGTGRELMIFRTNVLDLFSLVGSTDVVLRRLTVERGCLAGRSVVMNGSQPYWLGDDGVFYRLSGAGAEPIGLMQQDWVWGLQHPESCYGELFVRERVIRWTFPEDGVTIGFNLVKQHFFRDWSWDGSRRTPLGVHAAFHHNGRTFVGLSGGRVGLWGDEYVSDGGQRIRTIRRFTVPMSPDGRQARANALVFRHSRGMHDPRVLADVEWEAFPAEAYAVGDFRYVLNPEQPRREFRCIRAHTPSGLPFFAKPGFKPSTWEAYWVEVTGDQRTPIVVSYGFDQGSEAGRFELPVGELGDVEPAIVHGPLGFGREIWIEIDRSAAVPFAFTGGAVIAQPLGDGM